MSTESEFDAPAWLKNRHAQTIFPSTPLCRAPSPVFRRERIELPDGDFVEADWLGDVTDRTRPLVVVLHGLEGSSESTYARMLMQSVVDTGWSGVVLHFRGCGGSSNRLPRRYHAGDTDDVAYFLRSLRQQYGDRTILGVGYSLGGNVLMKLLGESSAGDYVDAAVGVSVPYDLHDSAKALERGGSRFYQRHLLRNMRRAMKQKYTPASTPFDWQMAMQATTFYEFDDIVTAPLHGFKNANEYYTRSSCRPYLRNIEVPSLLLGSLDDPFMTPGAYPDDAELSATTSAEFSETGGHVGFIYGQGGPWNARYWLPERILRYFVSDLGVGRSRSQSIRPQKKPGQARFRNGRLGALIRRPHRPPSC